MTPLPGTTKAQTIFLRSFRASTTGPAQRDWPSPSILRRWLRRPGFRAALDSVRDAFRFQADVQLAASATHALSYLSKDAPIVDVNRLLRISHLRQRFTATPPSTPPSARPPDSSHKHDPEIPKEKQCPLCKRRADDPLWIGDEEVFHEAAFKEGYTAPLQKWPDFPEPAPQDTFYYQLVQTPFALLWYMNQYDLSHNSDHRYQPILLKCQDLLPVYERPDFPLFTSQRQQTTKEPQ